MKSPKTIEAVSNKKRGVEHRGEARESLLKRLLALHGRRIAPLVFIVTALFAAGGIATPVSGDDGVPYEAIFNRAKPAFSWSVPDRYDRSWDSWHSGTRRYDANFVNPAYWTVNIDACASVAGATPIERYRVQVAGIGFDHRGTKETTSCKINIDDLPENNRAYQVRLSIRDGVGWTEPVIQRVQVTDYLVVSLGDSFASGEGNPDEPGDYEVETNHDIFADPIDFANVTDVNSEVVWKDTNCHRSARGGQAQAAKKLEDSDSRTSVTYVNLACSGASTKHVLNKRYDGQQPWSVLDGNEPQLDALMTAMLGREGDSDFGQRPPRTVDVLMLSIGMNDLEFSDVVTACTRPYSGDCVAEEAGSLDDLYVSLKRIASRLSDDFDVKNVYLTDYPVDIWGVVNCFGYSSCGGSCGWPFNAFSWGPFSTPGWGISFGEAQSMYDLGVKLNETLRQVATESEWNFLDGLTEKFHGHYYCSEERYYVHYMESWEEQGTKDGSMHPNQPGHRMYRDMLYPAIQPRSNESVGEPACITAKPTSPVPGTFLERGPQNFKWNTDFVCAGYRLTISTSGLGAPAVTYFDQSIDSGTVTIPDIPGDGRDVTFKLTTFTKPGVPHHAFYTYHTLPIIPCLKAAISAPANGSTLTTTFQRFTWQTRGECQGFTLKVGKSAASGEYFNGAVTGTWQTVSGLPTNGSKVYVTLSTQFKDGHVESNSYVYVASGQAK